jgi:hypothetical protein
MLVKAPDMSEQTCYFTLSTAGGTPESSEGSSSTAGVP